MTGVPGGATRCGSSTRPGDGGLLLLLDLMRLADRDRPVVGGGPRMGRPATTPGGGRGTLRDPAPRSPASLCTNPSAWLRSRLAFSLLPFREVGCLSELSECAEPVLEECGEGLLGMWWLREPKKPR